MRNWDPQLSESQPESVPSAKSRAVPSLSYPSSEARSSAGSSSVPPSACQWERDWKDVQAVAKYVGIPEDKVKLVDYSKEYWSKVFEPSVEVWQAMAPPRFRYRAPPISSHGTGLSVLTRVAGRSSSALL
jgi:hypothetical protein